MELGLDDRQAGGGALLAGVAEGRPHQVLDGQVDVGRAGDDHGVLAARLGQQPQRRLPVEEQPGGVVRAGEDDGVHALVRDQVPADLVVGAADQLHDVVGDPGRVELTDQLGRRGHGLGGRLEDDRVARGDRADDAVGRDGVREVPRSGHQHHAEGDAGHAAGDQLVERARAGGRPAGHVDALGHLRIALADGLGRLLGHHRERPSPCGGHHRRRGREELPALVGGRLRPGCGAAAGPFHHGVDRRRVDEQRWSGQGLRGAEVGLDPGAVGGDGEVGVGFVGEGLVGAEHPPFDRSILGLARDRRDVVTMRHRGLEGLALVPPGPRPRGDREQRPQEVPLRGVLVEPARQVGDAGRDVGRGHDRRVQQQAAGVVPGGASLGRRHPLEHLDLDRAVQAALVAQGQGPRHVEQVVARHAHPQIAAGGGVERGVEHRLEAGIDVGLVRVGRRRPPGQLGLDLLHPEVGSLHQPNPGPRATGGPAPAGPGDQLVEHGVGVGEVGLQRHAGREVLELGFVEHLLEGGQGQLQVPVLLHVQVDELRRRRGRRQPEEGPEPGDDPLDRVAEGQHVEVGAQRRDLHRHAVDVGARQPQPDVAEPHRGLVVAEDGLAEEVHVDVHPLGSPPRHVTGERRILGREDHTAHLPHDPCGHQPADDAGRRGGADGGQPEPGAVDQPEAARERPLGQGSVPAHGPAAVGRPEHLVGEAHDQLACAPGRRGCARGGAPGDPRPVWCRPPPPGAGARPAGRQRRPARRPPPDRRPQVSAPDDGPVAGGPGVGLVALRDPPALSSAHHAVVVVRRRSRTSHRPRCRPARAGRGSSCWPGPRPRRPR